MSITKNLLFEQYEREMKERAECKDCGFDWDSKFIILCPKHEREMSEAQAESDYYDELNQGRVLDNEFMRSSILSTDFNLMTL